MSSYFILGSTGLVGSNFLSVVNSSAKVSKICTISRRETKMTNSEKYKSIIIKDTDEWPKLIKDELTLPDKSTYFTGFGTTRKSAGSAENFVKIDRDINVNCLKAAKESGKFDTAIIVSSIGTNKDSRFLYPRTKGEIEEESKKMGFRRLIILRPGILLGERQESKGFVNKFGEVVGEFFRNTFVEDYIGNPIYGKEVAECAFKLSQKPITTEGEVLVLESKEIINIANAADN